MQEAISKFSFKIKTDHADAIYKCSDIAIFKVTLLDSMGKIVKGAKLSCELNGDWGLSQKELLINADDGSYIVKISLNKPGFVLCKVKYQPEDSQEVYEGVAGAGFEPLSIQEQRKEPVDFDDFWNKAKKELDTIPIKAQMKPVEISEKELECFDVKLECTDNIQVSGYLVKPKKSLKNSLPAYMRFHGAGVCSSNKLTAQAKEGFIAMDINAHGIENGKPDSFYRELENGTLDGYRTRDCNDRLKIYHRGMFQRVLRALEFLKSQPEWDGENLIVSGSSQGGAQALVAAAFDSQVSFCVANVPAFCLNTGILDGQNGFHWFIKLENDKFIQKKDEQTLSQEVIDTIAYYDAATFAKRINCPCILSTGFIDPYCPPTSVYVAFNNIPVKNKRIINNIYSGHDVQPETHMECQKAIKNLINKKGKLCRQNATKKVMNALKR